MQMLDFNEAFPKRVNISQYQTIIDAAVNAAKGKDGVPRVVVEDYASYQLALKAATAIRGFSQKNKLNLCVSCPKNGKRVFVYKGKPRTRKPGSHDAPTNPTNGKPAPESPAPESPAQA
jgi:hypothetical protein